MPESNPYGAPTTPVEAPEASRSPDALPLAGNGAPAKPSKWADRLQMAGMLGGMMGIILSVDEVTGFGHMISLRFQTGLIIAAISGLVGVLSGVIRRSWLHRVLAIPSGLLGGAGAFLLTCWWLEGRHSTSNYEMVFVEMLGALPGVGLFMLGLKKLGPKSELSAATPASDTPEPPTAAAPPP